MFSIMGVRSLSCFWPWCGLVSSTLRCCQSRQSVPPCRCLSGHAGVCPGCAHIPPHASLLGPVQNTCCSLLSCCCPKNRWCCLTLCRSGPHSALGSFRAVSSYILNLQPCKSSHRGSAVISGGAQDEDCGASVLASPLWSGSGCVSPPAVDVLLTPPFCSWLYSLCQPAEAALNRPCVPKTMERPRMASFHYPVPVTCCKLCVPLAGDPNAFLDRVVLSRQRPSCVLH